ncbi:glycosyltransferase family 39 protein [Listeria booriae]|uniref:glycosyltransferase family 39 protein n=1 Tax=Listeria booriae TaxID=1552123 RepID=UPI0016236E30|nr:glycosyltransferase family 39 protein [Listeria booriae]MBC2148292.1 hypothetical protein [Listeria booriae]
MIKKTIQTILLVVPILIALILMGTKLVFLNEEVVDLHVPVWQIALILLVGLILISGLSYLLYKLYHWRKGLFYLALIILIIVPRLIWILCFPIEPTSDFYLYHVIASYRADQNSWSTLFQENILDYAPFFTHILYFSTVLSWVYSFTGNFVIAGQLFNALLTLLGAILLFKACKNVFQLPVAVMATIIFSLWPSYFMYSTLLGAEPLFMALLALSMYIWTKLEAKKPSLFLSIVLALALVCMNYIRPLAAVILIAFIICSLITKWEWRNFWRKYVPVVVIFLVFLLAGGLINKILYPFPTASNFTGYSMYIGANEQSTGQWSEKDMKYFWSLYHENPDKPSNVSKKMQEKAIDRLQQTTKEGRLLSFETKKMKIFSDEGYGYEWNVYNNAPTIFFHSNMILAISNVIAELMILLSGIGLLIAIFCRRMKQVFLFALMEVGFTLSALLVEVQGRYHIPLIFVYSILVAFTLYSIIEITTRRISL